MSDPIDYRLLAENCSDGIYRLDLAGRLTYVNQRGAEMLGFTPEELLGRHFADFHVEEQMAEARRQFAERLAGLGGRSEYRLLRKDGGLNWIAVTSIRELDAAGACIGLIGFVRNMDAQKRAEAIRSHELRLLRRIAGDAPLQDVLDDLCLTLESLASRPLRCAVMIADRVKSVLSCLAAPSMTAAYRGRAAYAIQDGNSACAQALRAGRPIVIADALHDGSPEEELALRREHGYAAVWSNPILLDGQALGTLAFLPAAPCEPSTEDARLIEFGVEVARLALAHEHDMRALRESEQRFRDFAELSADWYWEQDADFRFTAISYGPPSMLPTIIHPGLEIVGKHRWELPYINVPDGFWEEHRRQLEAGRPFTDLHMQYRLPDGRIRHAVIGGRPLFDDTGRVAGYRGVGRDITAEITAREQLEKTQRWLEQAVRAANIGLWERDPDTWEFRFTANWKALFGYADDEVDNSQEGFNRLIHPDDLARAHAVARAYTTNPQGEYENRFRVRHKDGSWHWVLSRGSVVGDPATGRRSWMGCHIDITGQQRAEQALRESEALIARVLELLPVGVWIADAAGNIVRANEAGRRIWAGERHVGIAQYGEYKAWWPASGKRIAAEEWALARAVRNGEVSIDEEI